MIKNTISEDQIQAKFYQHCYNTWPQVRGLLFSVPNGGTRNQVEAMKLKATGLTPGIPDMIFIWDGKVYGFEFKTEVGVLSPAQVRIHGIWQSEGIIVEVFRDTETAIQYIHNLLFCF